MKPAIVTLVAAIAALVLLPCCQSSVPSKTPEVVFEAGAAIRSALASDGERIFFGDEAGVFRALEIVSGAEVWSFAADEPIRTRPVVDGPRVIFNAAQTLYILDTATGEPQAQATHPTEVRARVSDEPFAFNDSKTAVWRGFAYFAAPGGEIIEVEISTGTITRTHTPTTPGTVASGVDAALGKLYWVDYAGTVCALDIESWEAVFSTPIGDRVFAEMLIDGGRIYLGGRSCLFSCLDATTGEVIWSAPSADPTTWFSGGSIVTNGTLWAATSDEHTLLGLDAASGERRALLPTITNAYTLPVLHGDRIIVAATDVYALDGPDARADITAFDSSLGTVVWRTTLSDTVLSSPLVAGGALWVGSDSGRVYRFEL